MYMYCHDMFVFGRPCSFIVYTYVGFVCLMLQMDLASHVCVFVADEFGVTDLCV